MNSDPARPPPCLTSIDNNIDIHPEDAAEFVRQFRLFVRQLHADTKFEYDDLLAWSDALCVPVLFEIALSDSAPSLPD